MAAKLPMRRELTRRHETLRTPVAYIHKADARSPAYRVGLVHDTISRTVAARQLAEEHERRRVWREIKTRADLFIEQYRA
jgi:hypothetical protein